MGRGDIGHERIPWRAANAFANAVDETGGHHPPQRRGQRKYRFGEGREAISDGHDQLALAEPVRERARKYFNN